LPWRETSPVNERKHFIDAHQRGELSVSELCRRFRISRKTGYKWLERFYGDGADDEEALRDRSRRPHSHPRAVPTWLEEVIVQSRKQRPHWGPKKLRAVLVHRNPGVELPAVSTCSCLHMGRRQPGWTEDMGDRSRAGGSAHVVEGAPGSLFHFLESRNERRLPALFRSLLGPTAPSTRGRSPAQLRGGMVRPMQDRTG